MEEYIIKCKSPPKAAKAKSKRKKHFADYVVGISLTAVIAYTVVAFVLQFLCGIEVSPTLTGCYFSFFGVELINLALIKRGKIKAADIMPTVTVAAGADKTETEGGNYGRGV